MRALPQDHPLVPLLRHAPDFQDEAAIADALLNPHDRPYSVPQLFDFIDGAGRASRNLGCAIYQGWRG
jgi:hypothetical protein